jgi:hypothetical protein
MLNAMPRWRCQPPANASPRVDFDIVIAEPENAEELVELASDVACPAHDYVLGCLYCMVGRSDLADARIADAAHQAST